MRLGREILRSSGFWTINKTLTKTLGLKSAFMLNAIAEMENRTDDWGDLMIEMIEKEAGIPKKEQLKEIDILIKGEFVIKVENGYKIDEFMLKQIIFS